MLLRMVGATARIERGRGIMRLTLGSAGLTGSARLEEMRPRPMGQGGGKHPQAWGAGSLHRIDMAGVGEALVGD
jgi:hypothetical protein